MSVLRWWSRALVSVSCVFWGVFSEAGLGPLGANLPGASPPQSPYQLKAGLIGNTIRYDIISYDMNSYHIIWYDIISSHIISYHVTSYHLTSPHIKSYDTILSHIISHRIIAYHIYEAYSISIKHMQCRYTIYHVGRAYVMSEEQI